uniref:NADH-ubiquinone oxidoreductase chain 2 n=1 Tax=Brontispa longissima TaxID=111217 RepID=A0A7T8V7T6_BROLO|nr:NADH dehydrogenase subunit 2 [Brontispa longissima]QQQ89062.1 NADH dehydrogenase subunit 2 [Brontispa longissima]UAJ48103.1 NADH dehydrogenase subunit 2 [Brontispa longissima]URQ17576.1 NADH dehydrogenase subunit 2 [Brontispa longissima]
MFKIYKIIMFNFMIIGSMITISSSTPFMMWMGLEMNLLSIIPIFEESKTKYPAEASMKYFMAQAMASKMLLLALLIIELNSNYQLITNKWTSILIIQTALFIKLGMAPFHIWMPEVAEGLNWMSCMLLFTWQKLAPMVMFMMFYINTKFLVSVIIFSSIIGGILGLNQLSMRKILTYSSINHMAWMMLAMSLSSKLWTTYFLLYSLMNILIISILKSLNIFFINQLNSAKIKSINKILIMMTLLSLAGLPPFIGFLPKWMVIILASENNLLILPAVMIITTLISLFMYLRLIVPMMTLKSNQTLISTKNLPKSPLFICSTLMISLSLASLILGN